MNEATDASASTQAFIALSLDSFIIPYSCCGSLTARGFLVVASLAEHPIIADDGRIAGLRRLNTALGDSALEQPKRRQRRNRTGAVLDRGEMDEGAVAELQGQIANPFRRFFPQFLKHLLDQAFVLLRLLRFRPVAHQGPFHEHALRLSSVVWVISRGLPLPHRRWSQR